MVGSTQNNRNIRMLNGEHAVIEMLRVYLKLPESAREPRTASVDLTLYGPGNAGGHVSCFSVSDSHRNENTLKNVDWKNGPEPSEKNEALLMTDSLKTAKSVKAFLEMVKEKYKINYESLADLKAKKGLEPTNSDRRFFTIDLNDFLRVDETGDGNL
jgi:hypothetical protein